jgi:hypothetical protein
MSIEGNDHLRAQEISRTTYIDAIDHCFKRKRKFGILALPSVIAALDLLPQEHQLLIGTACRQYIVQKLYHQEILFQRDWKAWQNTYRTRRRFSSFLPFLKDDEDMPQPIPSFVTEAKWLIDHVDRESPFQCLLLSRLYETVEQNDDAKIWYAQGLSALRHLAEEFPTIPLGIIE